MYDWFKNCTKEEFKEFVRNQGTQEFVCDHEHIEDGPIFYLINNQEKTIMKIANEEVVKFIYHNIYIPTVNKTYIDAYIKLGDYTLSEWE